MKTRTTLDEFEQAGIAAMVRAGDQENWFSGHFGAAMLAGVRLLRETELPAPAAQAITARLETLRLSAPEWYSGLTDIGASMVGVQPVLQALRDSAGTLRTSGHPTIYMSIALELISRRPEFATERVIAALLDLYHAARDDDPARYLGKSNYFEWIDDASCQEESQMLTGESLGAVRSAFAALDWIVPDQIVNGRHHFLAGEKIHLVTHAHAIATLEGLGHSAIAQRACVAQESLRSLTSTSNDLPPSDLPPSKSVPFEASFWEQEVRDLGHVLKLAEAVVAQLPRLMEAERQVAESRLPALWALLGIR